VYHYLLRRLVQSIIVIFSVISLVFLLQSYGVTDPVDDFLSSSFGEMTTSKEEYKKAYIKEAKRQKKDLPLFYFSIVPSYFPDDLHTVIFEEDRQYLKQLLRYSRCSTCTESFWDDIKALDTTMAYDTTLTKESQAILARISRERNFNLLKAQMNRLRPTDHPVTNQIVQSYDDLANNRASVILPKLLWHGSSSQYHHYLKNTITGNLGKSKSDGKSAGEKISNALKWTFTINVISLIFVAGIGLWLGLWSIKNDGTRFEKGLSSSLLFIYTMPVFWIATLFLVFFTTERYGSWMDIFPTPGIKYWYAQEPIWRQIWLSAGQLILPVICIVIHDLAYMSRIMKSKFAEVLSSNYITTLRAKGLSKKLIYNRHVLRNGLIPYITILTGSIPSLFAGSLVIEVIFNVPGIGKLLVDSIYASDWPVITGIVLMMSVVTVLSYFLADILYSKVNPRIELGS